MRAQHVSQHEVRPRVLGGNGLDVLNRREHRVPEPAVNQSRSNDREQVARERPADQSLVEVVDRPVRHHGIGAEQGLPVHTAMGSR